MSKTSKTLPTTSLPVSLRRMYQKLQGQGFGCKQMLGKWSELLEDGGYMDIDLLATKLAESEKISRLATGHHNAPEQTQEKLRISSELLQDLILKLLLADARGQGLKANDTVHLARALKEMLGMHERLAVSANASRQPSDLMDSKSVHQAMRALGLLSARQMLQTKHHAVLKEELKK